MWLYYVLLSVIGVLLLATPVVVQLAKEGGAGMIALVCVLVMSLGLMWVSSPQRPW
jgi:hypothetical protein